MPGSADDVQSNSDDRKNEAETTGPTPVDLRVTCGGVDLGTPTETELPDTPLEPGAVAAAQEAEAALGGEAELFPVYVGCGFAERLTTSPIRSG